VLLITQHYPPDIGAPAFRMKGLVRALRRRGHRVIVLTATPNRYARFVPQGVYEEEGERVVRIKVPAQPGSFFTRSVIYLYFFLRVLPYALFYGVHCDVIVATSPQLFVAVLGAIVSHVLRKPLVLDIRDLWPDEMIDLGILTRDAIAFRTLKSLERFCYRSANLVVLASPAFEGAVEQTFPGVNTAVVTNGLDDEFLEAISSVGSEDRVVKKPPFLVLYAGNIGVKQDLLSVVGAVKDLEGDFDFLFVGDGSQRKEIEDFVAEKGIKNLTIRDPVSRDKLIEYYRKADIFLITCHRSQSLRRNISSKLFECLATGKPVVYGMEGVSKELMEEIGGGIYFPPGDKQAFVRALREAAKILREGRVNAGVPEVLKRKYLRSVLMEKFARLIEWVGKGML